MLKFQSLVDIKRRIVFFSDIICFTRASGHAQLTPTRLIILFKSPWDVQPIDVFGRQLNNTEFIRDCYKKATNEPFGHIMIDFDPRTN